MRVPTWKVLRWDNAPPDPDRYELACPKCCYSAMMPIGDCGALLIAAIGLGLIFDPPGHIPPRGFMPSEVQCRNCRTIWESSDVR